MQVRSSVVERLLAGPMLAAALLAAAGCGADGSPSPTPSAVPPASPARVHVLAPPHVSGEPGRALLSTFDVLASGELLPLAQLDLEGARLIASDPLGRFLYVAGLRRRFGYVKSYSWDPTARSLVQRSDATPSPWSFGSTPFYFEPYALAAREREVLVSFEDLYGLEPFVVDRPTGALSEGPRPYLDLDNDPGWLALHPSLPVVYVDDRSGSGGSGILVLSPQEDGRLAPIGHARTQGALGGAFEAVSTAGCLVAAWQTSPVGSVPATKGLSAFREDSTTGLLSDADTVTGLAPGHLAAGSGDRVAVNGGSALLLFATSPSCQLVPLATVPITPAPYGPGRLAFHPSGELLYVDESEGIRGYRISSGGRVERLPVAPAPVHGQIVVARLPD